MSEPLRKCPGCGLFVNSKGNFCPYCGARLDSNIVICPNCLKENRAGDKVCSFCGAFLNTSYPGQDLQEDRSREERRFSRRSSREKREEERFGRKLMHARQTKKRNSKRDLAEEEKYSRKEQRIEGNDKAAGENQKPASKDKAYRKLVRRIFRRSILCLIVVVAIINLCSNKWKNRIESQVLYDQNGIVLTAESIEADYEEISEDISRLVGYCLDLEIRNNTDEDVTITVVDGNVNGYMFDFGRSEDVEVTDYYIPAESMQTCKVYLLKDRLDDAGIRTILDVEFRIEIENQDDSDEDVYTSDFLTVTTRAYGRKTQEYDDSGTVEYDEDGLKIVYQGISKDSDFYYLKFYMENESGRNIDLVAEAGEEVQLNDTYTLYTTEINIGLLDGKKYIHVLSFSKDDMKEYCGIDSKKDFEEFVFSYEILDSDTLEVIGDTGEMTVDLN